MFRWLTRKTDDAPDRGRRAFFRTAGAGAVAGGTAIVTGSAQAAPVGAAETGQGYRETDHVRRYYESARM